MAGRRVLAAGFDGAYLIGGGLEQSGAEGYTDYPALSGTNAD